MIHQAKSRTAIEEWQTLMDHNIPLPLDFASDCPRFTNGRREPGSLDPQAFSPTLQDVDGVPLAVRETPRLRILALPRHFSVRAQLAPIGRRIFNARGRNGRGVCIGARDGGG